MGGFKTRQLPRQLTGYGAAALSVYFLIQYRTDFPIVATSIYFLLVCITDTQKSKIPNLLNLSLALFGIIFNGSMHGWTGISNSITGMFLGLALLMIPYLLGGFGAGDVKALAAVGSVTGPEALLYIFIYMAFWGGAMAVLHYSCNRDLTMKLRESLRSLKTASISLDATDLTPKKTETLRFPYAAAIAFGYFSYLTWGSLL